MTSFEYQRDTREALGRFFDDVRVEWSVVRDATDALAADEARYAPRTDIAVGPFNTTPGPDRRLTAGLLPDRFKELFDDCQQNPNPRCLLAIEVVFSGSSKHIMGDILNASSLGLYGVIVGRDTQMPKIHRILKYEKTLAQLEKQPRLFRNVAVLSVDAFAAILQQT